MKKLKHGLPKIWLQLLSGLMWSSVRIFLISLTPEWIEPVAKVFAVTIVLAGGILGVLIYTFGFSKLADRNIERIEDIQSERPCIFAFQAWTSYPLLIFMISLGIFLRVYSPIPKSWLAGMYIGIGFSLFLASLHYYKHLWAGIRRF